MLNASSRKTSACRQSRGTGFTLIELLVSMAIILILASLLFLGARTVLNGGNSNSTRVTLAQLNAMLGELDAKTHLKPPKAWTWLDDTNNPTFMKAYRYRIGATSKYVFIDFWHYAYIPSTSVRGITDPSKGYPDALDAPGQVGSDSGAARSVSRQILNTQLVMNLLFSMPNNRNALDKMSADRYYIPAWQAISNKVVSPGLDGVAGTGDDGTEDVYYPVGVRLSASDATNPQARFRAKISDKAQSQFPSGDNNHWAKDTSPIAPILKDSWGNPIIFVPGAGLRVRLLNGAKEYSDPNVITAIVVSPEGRVKIDQTNTNPPYTVTPGRPFFASAGPDGDFSKGDDNIYSFEK